MMMRHTKPYAFALISTLLVQMAATVAVMPEAGAIGPISPLPAVRPTSMPKASRSATSVKVKKKYPGAVRIKKQARKKTRAAKKPAVPVKPPQDLVNNMSIRTLAPGVVHKVHRGAMYINVLDLDLAKAQVHVKPVMAGETFNRLEEVKDQASRVSAIAAVNGNYFKKDGTPLGTLLIDGEWIAGPIYDRTSLGITADGEILVDRVNLHGILESSNPEVQSIWVNNINQPRRTGSHLVVYTRRWGAAVRMQYEGCLIAVDASGRVVDKTLQTIAVPYGGFVLSDGKSGEISRLKVGDLVNLKWHTKPEKWSKVVHAVSGGPVIIRDGQLYVGLKDENFRKSWTGRQITARTAIGVTANRHLILATIEGPHTLWDVAKFLKKLGCVDAINLDGGGSTTMWVDGTTVTRNKSTFQRRVASSLVVLAGSDPNHLYRGVAQNYVPTSDISDFTADAPPVAPDMNSTGYEIVETQPGTATVDGPNQQPTEQATPGQRAFVEDDQVIEATAPKKSKVGKMFGWMKHLNPMGD
jgi:uncharacterized protein YigE (DUF2233 family)